MDSEQNVMVWTKIWSQIKRVNQKKKRFFLNKIMKQLVVIVKASDGISSKTKKKKGSDPKNLFLAEFDRIWIRKKGRDSWKNQKET